MGLTPDRKKSAVAGVALTMFGLFLLMYGTILLPLPRGERLFGGLLLVIFGFLMSTSSVLIFILPAAYDYLEEATRQRQETS